MSKYKPLKQHHLHQLAMSLWLSRDAPGPDDVVELMERIIDEERRGCANEARYRHDVVRAIKHVDPDPRAEASMTTAKEIELAILARGHDLGETVFDGSMNVKEEV